MNRIRFSINGFWKKKGVGFTLIELLLVIALIGLLASIVFVSVRNVKAKARDVKRLSDLRQVSAALELYYAQHGHYPDSHKQWRSECYLWNRTRTITRENVIPGLVPDYFSSFPSDPAMNKDKSDCCYIYKSDGSDYAFLAHNCSETNYRSAPNRIDPVRDGGREPCAVDENKIWAWKVSSPGGRCW